MTGQHHGATHAASPGIPERARYRSGKTLALPPSVGHDIDHQRRRRRGGPIELHRDRLTRRQVRRGGDRRAAVLHAVGAALDVERLYAVHRGEAARDDVARDRAGLEAAGAEHRAGCGEQREE